MHYEIRYWVAFSKKEFKLIDESLTFLSNNIIANELDATSETTERIKNIKDKLIKVFKRIEEEEIRILGGKK